MVSRTIVLFFSLAVISCNENATNLIGNKDSAKFSQTDSVKNNLIKVDRGDKKDDSVIKQHQLINEHIKGLWVLVGDETGNVSLDIKSDSIYYPDSFKSYKYTIIGDSIKIYFSDFVGSYLVEMKGADTMFFNGEQKEKYFRSKD